jgi:hypothetical protein
MGVLTGSQSGELEKPGYGRLISFNVIALELAHLSENLSVPDDSFKYLSLYETYMVLQSAKIIILYFLSY